MLNLISEIFEYLIEISKKYDTTSKFWIGHMCGIIVQKPNDLQILFNSTNALEKSNFYKSIPLHNGMVVGPGEWVSMKYSESLY